MQKSPDQNPSAPDHFENARDQMPNDPGRTGNVPDHFWFDRDQTRNAPDISGMIRIKRRMPRIMGKMPRIKTILSPDHRGMIAGKSALQWVFAPFSPIDGVL
jgi:hypothetical protein